MFCCLYRFAVMGSSTSSAFSSLAPRRVFWTRREEDKIQLDDLWTNCNEEFWIIEVKQRVCVKKIHLPQSIQCIDLTAQQGDAGFYHGAERLNPAFVGDQGC